MTNPKGIHVLIAEDDYLVREMIKGLLEELGYTPAGEARDGIEAISMVQALEPDVILMDIKMPDMDGIEATRLIQKRCPTPVVALSAHESPRLIEEASTAGIGAYLVKPINASELERAITIAIARFDDLVTMRQLNIELQARNEELDAFARTVAHDLKAPLVGIVGLADFLVTHYTAISQEEMIEHLQAITQSGNKMCKIIEGLLLLCTVRQQAIEVKPLDMSSVVEEALQRLTAFIEESQAEIVLPDEWPLALGHATWVEEVWTNYLSNAIKYGGQPPQIKVGGETLDDGHARFWVQDNGQGLTREEQAQLFTPFTRLEQIRHIAGHGLGLSITRFIVEKLGGQVHVESEVGEGSIFAFTLPSAS